MVLKHGYTQNDFNICVTNECSRCKQWASDFNDYLLPLGHLETNASLPARLDPIHDRQILQCKDYWNQMSLRVAASRLGRRRLAMSAFQPLKETER